MLSFSRRPHGVEGHRCEFPSHFQGRQLVSLQGNERRDHEGWPRQQGPGELIDSRLAAGCGHYSEGVHSIEHALDGFALARPQRPVAK